MAEKVYVVKRFNLYRGKKPKPAWVKGQRNAQRYEREDAYTVATSYEIARVVRLVPKFDAKAFAKLHGLKTIKRDELCRLAFCNSKKLPHVVIDDGERKEWVGIGWIELHDQTPHKDDVVIV